jgi:hypothetical protein
MLLKNAMLINQRFYSSKGANDVTNFEQNFFLTFLLFSLEFFLKFQIRRVTLIPGDGIGKEISVSVQKIFEAAKAPIEWDAVDVTPVKGIDGKMRIPQKAIDSVEGTRIGLKGPLATPVGKGHQSLNLALRK